MAPSQLAGADFLVGMDRHRADVASQLLEPVPTRASTTTAQLAKRFTPTHTAGIENGIGTVNARVLRLLPQRRRIQLLTSATIDEDTADVEVYGPKKHDAVYNHQGQRAYRAAYRVLVRRRRHPFCGPDEGGRGSMPGRRAPVGPGDRATAPGVAKERYRWDARYCAADLAKHRITKGVEFAIGVKRNSAVVRASRSAWIAGWHPAKDMDHV